MRVAILYRVMQHFRVPVFQRLSQLPGWEVKVFYGCDFPGTKIVSAKGPFNFSHKRMWSCPVRLPTGAEKDARAPLSPLLIVELHRFKPDVILCEGGSNLLNNLIAYTYARFAGIPFVQWGLGRIKGRRSSRLRRLVELVLVPMERGSDAIISYSATGAEYFREIGVPDEKIFIATNVVDTEQRLQSIAAVPASDRIKESEFNVLFVGALERPKKVDLLIRAFSKLQAYSQKGTSLRIVGDGYERKRLEALAQELNLKNVFFEGKVTEGVSKFFLKADVFVLPGLGGLAVSDALVHGLPVICTIGDGCEADLVVSGHNGYFEASLDENTLFKRLKYLLENEQELARMKSNATESLRGKDIHAYIATISKALTFACGGPVNG